MTSARKEVEQTHRRVDDEVQNRRRHLDRCRRDLEAAQAALARCTENCSGLERAVRDARARCDEAERRHRDGKRALQLVSDARGDLVAVMQSVEAAVSEHGSIASSALADLDARIEGILRTHSGQAARAALAGILVEIAGVTVGLSDTAADAAHALNVNVPLGHESVAELRTDEQDRETDYLGKRLYKLPEGYEIGERKDRPNGT